MVSRMGPSGKPVRVTTLSADAWVQTLKAIDLGVDSCPGWPGSGVFKQFSEAWLASNPRDEFIELDAGDMIPLKRRLSADERAATEISLKGYLDRGLRVSDWLRDNPGLLARSTAYRWARDLREDASEKREGMILRVISGGMS